MIAAGKTIVAPAYLPAETVGTAAFFDPMVETTATDPGLAGSAVYVADDGHISQFLQDDSSLLNSQAVRFSSDHLDSLSAALKKAMGPLDRAAVEREIMQNIDPAVADATINRSPPPRRPAFVYDAQTPNDVRSDPDTRPSPAKIDGLQALHLSLGQHQTMRQALRLELRLSMEISQRIDQTGEDFYDDAWSETDVPRELIEISDLLTAMSKTETASRYVALACEVLDKTAHIQLAEHKMMAFCQLAEELSHHEALKPCAEELYSDHFRAAFSSTPKHKQPALSLMVAASRLRAGLDPKFVAGMVERTLAIADEESTIFRGSDARNLCYILEHWPQTADDLQKAAGWIARFVKRENWVPKPENIKFKKPSAETAAEDVPTDGAENAVDEVAVAVEDAQLPAPAAEAAPIDEPTREPLAREQRSYLRSRLVQYAMRRIAAERGVTQEVFIELMHLAAEDTWEETAAVAYDILSTGLSFRPQLAGALPHFTNSHYRAKAAYFMAVRSNAPDAGARRAEVIASIEAGTALSPLQRAHEVFILQPAGAAALPDPLDAILNGEALPTDLPAGAHWRNISAWAERGKQRIAGLAGAAAEQVEHARADQSEALPPPPVATEEPDTDEDEEGSEEKIKDDAEEASRLSSRTGELAFAAASELLKRKPDDVEARKAAIRVVAKSGSARSIAFIMGQLPENTDPEVRTEAELLITGRLGVNRYYRALANLLLNGEMMKKKTPQAAAIRKEYLDAAAEDDEGVTNAAAIEELAFFARSFEAVNPGFSKSLLALARKRADIYREEITALENAASEEDPASSADLENLRALLGQAEASVLGSIPWGARNETGIEKSINKIKDPFYIAMARKIRAAHIVSGIADYSASAARIGAAYQYMEKAISGLSAIEKFGSRISIGMEMLDEILNNPFFSELSSELPKYLGDKYAEVSSSLELANTRHAAQDPWFAPERFLGLLDDPAITAPQLGRLATSKQLGKYLKRGAIPIAAQVGMLRGKLVNGAYQGAFYVLKPILEEEEKDPSSQNLPQIYEVFDILLRTRDSKALDYAIERKHALTGRIQNSEQPAPLSAADWHWIELFISFHMGGDFVPLISSGGLVHDDKLQLFERLIKSGVIDPDSAGIFKELKTGGKEDIFFSLMGALSKALPGVKITKAIVKMIIDDPRFGMSGEGIAEIVESYASAWGLYQSLQTPEERLALLSANKILSEAYFRQEEKRFNFGENAPPMNPGIFQGIVDRAASLNYGYNHSPVMRYEQALENAHPTTETERAQSLAAISANADIDDEDRGFLEGIVHSSEPLSEEAIKRIMGIGKKNEISGPESMLPPNRQRIYRLYWGDAPIVNTTEGYRGSRDFVRWFRPEEKERSLRPQDLHLEFRLAFSNIANTLLRANRSLKEVERIVGGRRAGAYPEEAAMMGAIMRERTELLEGENDMDRLVDRSKRLLARAISLSDSAGRESLAEGRRMVNDHLNGTLLKRMYEERSLLLLSSHALTHSNRKDETVRTMKLKEVYPQLDEFNAMKPEKTPKKSEIAARLGLTDEWEKRPGHKAMVELELMAELAEMDAGLHERFFLPMRELMRNKADAEVAMLLERSNLTERASRGNFEVRHVDKKDLLTYLRIADFRPCCISTDGMFYFPNVPGYHKDRMTQIFAIYDPDTRRVVGHMVGHLGLSGKDEEPAYFLNGLYLKTQYRGEAMDDAIFKILDEFARAAGIDIVRHGINQYHDVTRKPPAGFSAVTSDVVRLETIMEKDGKPVPLYGDLGFDRAKANDTQKGISHYQHRVE